MLVRLIAPLVLLVAENVLKVFPGPFSVTPVAALTATPPTVIATPCVMAPPVLVRLSVPEPPTTFVRLKLLL